MDAPPFDQVCVWREGDFNCPEGPFSDKTLHFSEIVDDRKCTDCECDQPFETCSGLTMNLFSANGCGQAPIAGVGTNLTCTQIPNQGVTAARRTGTGVFNFDCTGLESGGESVGTAGAIGPVTLCCL